MKKETTDEHGLRTIEPDGSPARSRFSDPVALRNTYDVLTQDDTVEANRRAKLQNLFEGCLPYDPAELERCGLKNITNVNWLGMKGAIDNRADAFYKLGCDTTNLIELQPKARELAGPDAYRIASVFAQEFSTMLREGGDVIPALAMMNTQSDLYGLGPVTWLNDIDYRPVALLRGQVRFVSDGPVLSSRHELFMFQSTLEASYLFFLLDNEEIAAAEGWDLAGIRSLLVAKFRDHIDTSAMPHVEDGTSYVEQSISLIRQNRFEEEHQFERIEVIHAFVKELGFPRGITHIIIPGSAIPAEKSSFLMRKANAYRTMDECFLWMPYSTNYSKAREVRGLASYLYPIELVSNKYKCRVMDLAFQYASLIYTQQSIGSQQQITMLENGPVTVVPKELQPVQNNTKPDMQQVMAVSQFMDGIGVNSVTGNDKAEISQTGPKLDKGTDRETKAEVEIKQRLRSRKEEALFVRKIGVLDKIFRETFRRTVRLVKMILQNDPAIVADFPEVADMLDRCSQRGVTPEQILAAVDQFNVVTCRDLVLGSDGKVGVLTNVLSGFGGTLDEPGRRNMLRDIVQLQLGSQSADRYAPENTRDNAPSDQSSMATLENGMMRLGQSVSVGADQLHWSHIPVHSQLINEIVESVAAPEDNQPDSPSFGGDPDSDLPIGEKTLQNTGNDPKRVLNVLMTCSKHVQEHLSVGGQQIGMEAAAKKVAEMLRGLRPTVKALNLAIATQERVEQARQEEAERQRQEEIDKLAQEKAQVAQIEADKKAETERYAIDRNHEVQLHKLDLERQVAGARADDELRRSAADDERKNAETAARISREQQMNDARIKAAESVNRQNAVQSVTGQQAVSPRDVMATQEEEWPPEAL